MKIQLRLLLRRGLRHPRLQEAHHLENEIEQTESYARDPWLLFPAEESQLKTDNQIWRCAIRSCGVLEHTTLDNEFIRYSGKTTEHPHPQPHPTITKRDLLRGLSVFVAHKK